MKDSMLILGPKKDFSHKEWEGYKTELTMRNPNYGYKDRRELLKFYKEFEEDEDVWLEVPRNFVSLRNYEEDIYEGKPININFDKPLRDYQKEYFDKNCGDLFYKTDKVIEAGAGSGKTAMSIYLIAKFGRKTLVTAPTDFLCKQYADRAKFFLPGAKIYMASATRKIDISEADVVIITYDLLLSRKFGEDFWSEFGHFIVDEAHKMGTELYQSIILGAKCKYRTALSATFRREDKLEKILGYHFGIRVKMPRVNPLVHVVKYETGIKIPAVITMNLFKNSKRGWDFRENFINLLDEHDIYYELRDTSIHVDPYEVTYVSNMLNPKKAEDRILRGMCKKAVRNLEETSYVAAENYTSDHFVRRMQTVRLIEKCVSEGRAILLISKRKKVLYELEKMLSRRGIDCQVVVRETDVQNNLELLENRKVILGISKIAKEGFDVDYLDTLIIYHAIGDTEQALGRIARIKEGKKTPIAYYMVDDSHLMEGLWKKAQKFIPLNGKVVDVVSRNELKLVKKNGKLKNRLLAWSKSGEVSKRNGRRNAIKHSDSRKR